MMACAATFWLGGMFSVPVGYAVARNAGAEPLPWLIVAVATLFWPLTLMLGVAGVMGDRRL